GDPHSHGVDQNIAVVAGVEIHRSADGRHAKTIAIGADPGDDARNEMARAGMPWRTKPKQVEASDGPRAHRKNIAQDSTNARRRALKRLDEGREVVAFHLEDASEPIANVDDARVFTRALNDPWRFCGEFAQMNF